MERFILPAFMFILACASVGLRYLKAYMDYSPIEVFELKGNSIVLLLVGMLYMYADIKAVPIPEMVRIIFYTILGFIFIIIAAQYIAVLKRIYRKRK